SKTIYTVGVAVMQAAQAARKQTLEIAARGGAGPAGRRASGYEAGGEGARRQTLEIAASELEASVDDLELVDGKVVVRGVPNKGVTLQSIGKKGNLYMSKIEPVLGASHPAFSQQAPAFAPQLALVEIDPDTGEVTLKDFVIVQDVGKAITPLAVEGQMQGGAVQSLG